MELDTAVKLVSKELRRAFVAITRILDEGKLDQTHPGIVLKAARTVRKGQGVWNSLCFFLDEALAILFQHSASALQT